MAHTGKAAKSPEWWKHLRKEKKTFWKRERRGFKHMIRKCEA